MNKRYYQRCSFCKERAFEFKKNPEQGVVITLDDIVYNDLSIPKNFSCQFCKNIIPKEQFGGGYLIARLPPNYTKYKGSNPIHFTWYRSGNKMYKDLVDSSLVPFKDCSGSILDIGFGDGLVASLFNQMGFKVYGIEPEKEGVNAAKRMGVDTSNVYIGTIEDYVKTEMKKVDWIYSLNTIEHVNDSTAFIKVMDSCKKGAVIITDNALNKDGNRRLVKELHTKEFSYDELKDLFKDFQTEPVETNNGSFIGIKINK